MKIRTLNKKSQEVTLWFLISAVAFVFVIFLLANIANNFASGKYYYKLRVAKDLALQINAISSVPGNAYLINTNEMNYSYRFSKNQVTVFEGTNFLQNSLFSASYKFVPIYDQEINTVLENPRYVIISKKNGKLEFSKDPLNLAVIETEKIKMESKLDESLILIDAAHGGDESLCYDKSGTKSKMKEKCGDGESKGDPGIKSPYTTESKTIYELSQILKVKLSLKTQNVFLSREDEDQYLSINKRNEIINEKNPSIIISLHTSNINDPQKDPVEIYISSLNPKQKESRYLASLIQDEFIKRFGIYARVSYVNPLVLGEDEPKRILQAPKTALIIEVGNLFNPDSIVIQNKQEIADAIYTAILRMYDE